MKLGISHPFAAQADLGVYAASKVALKALADATRAELRAAKRPYRVSCLSPGLVETDFYLAKAGPHAAGLVARAHPSVMPWEYAGYARDYV